MSKKLIQGLIAEMMGFDDPRAVKTSLSFTEDLGMDEDEVMELLEALEAETDLDIIPYADRFETVRDLVDFIEDAQ